MAFLYFFSKTNKIFQKKKAGTVNRLKTIRKGAFLSQNHIGGVKYALHFYKGAPINTADIMNALYSLRGKATSSTISASTGANIRRYEEEVFESRKHLIAYAAYLSPVKLFLISN